VAAPFLIDGREVRASVSVGIALSTVAFPSWRHPQRCRRGAVNQASLASSDYRQCRAVLGSSSRGRLHRSYQSVWKTV